MRLKQRRFDSRARHRRDGIFRKDGVGDGTLAPGGSAWPLGYNCGQYKRPAAACFDCFRGTCAGLEAGAFFGEMALLSGGLRTADVIAVDFCQFLKLDRRDFNIFMARHPRLRAAVSDMARERKKMNVPGNLQGGAVG